MKEIEVWLGTTKFGHLVATEPARWSVIPTDENTPDRAPYLSVLFPETRRPWQDAAVRKWFQQLLPEPDVVRALSRRLGVSAGNDFALLAAIGGDCQGAVNFAAPGTKRSDESEHRSLSEEELRHLIAALPERPLLTDVEGARYVLPGARPKIPVCIQQEQITLALGGAGTTHILKSGDGELEDLALNEWFCMRLARLADINVASVFLRKAYSTLLLVERTDRLSAPDGSISAVHMEDFCQIWSVEPMQKFEREGGLSTADCAEILRRFSIAPALDLREFLKWIVFGYLIGFGGGHAKQLTLLHTPDGPRLGPFFGIWSTHVYSRMSERLAMSIGREDRPDWLIAGRWKDFARQLGIRPRYVLQVLEQFAQELPNLFQQVLDETGSAPKRTQVLLDIQELVRKRCRQALVSIATESS